MLDDEIAPQDFGQYVRPMVSSHKFEDAVAIAGIGVSQLGRWLMVPPLSPTVQDCRQAITDAGLTFDDIDDLATYPGAGMLSSFTEGG